MRVVESKKEPFAVLADKFCPYLQSKYVVIANSFKGATRRTPLGRSTNFVQVVGSLHFYLCLTCCCSRDTKGSHLFKRPCSFELRFQNNLTLLLGHLDTLSRVNLDEWWQNTELDLWPTRNDGCSCHWQSRLRTNGYGADHFACLCTINKASPSAFSCYTTAKASFLFFLPPRIALMTKHSKHSQTLGLQTLKKSLAAILPHVLA